jgi:hypothetical protein
MEDKDLQEQLKKLQIKHESLIREYCNLMDENRKLKGEINAKQLQGEYTQLSGKGYLIMNKTKDDLKIQINIMLVLILFSVSGIISGLYLIDATSYTNVGIGIAVLFLWFFSGCVKTIRKLVKESENKE